MQQNSQQGSIVIALLFIFVLLTAGAAGFIVINKSSDDTNKSSAPVSTKSVSQQNNTDRMKAEDVDPDLDLKNYLVNLVSAISESTANNDGKIPTEIDSIRMQLSGHETYKDWPSAGVLLNAPAAKNTIYYASGYSCDDATNSIMEQARSPRSVAILAVGPSGKTYCLD